jgi:hypothetical protein
VARFLFNFRERNNGKTNEVIAPLPRGYGCGGVNADSAAACFVGGVNGMAETAAPVGRACFIRAVWWSFANSARIGIPQDGAS